MTAMLYAGWKVVDFAVLDLQMYCLHLQIEQSFNENSCWNAISNLAESGLQEDVMVARQHLSVP
jgi:hypothetical protein